MVKKIKQETNVKKFSLKLAFASAVMALLLTIGFSIISTYIGLTSGWLMLLAFLGFGYWLYRKGVVRKIVGKGFIGLGIEAFLTPIAAFIFTAVFAVNQSDAFSAAGAAIGGGIATIFIGVLAFFLGTVFFVIGYFTLKKD